MRFLQVQTKPHHTRSTGVHHDLPEGMVRPGHVQRFLNLVGSAGKVAYETINGRPLFVPDLVFESRMVICRACPAFDNLHQVCTRCGCNAKAKLRLAAMVCPWKEHNISAPKWGMWAP